MSLLEYAKEELALIGSGDCEMQAEMNKDILEIVDVFSKQGHSGFSANYAINILNKILRQEPITPLTGNEDEWNEVGEGVYQNKRCSHVFKQHDRFNGQAYDIDGKIFREPNGVCYTNSESRVPIEFPYTPKSEYVDVQE